MPQALSIKGIAIGVLFLFATYFACGFLIGLMFPFAPVWLKLIIVPFWHCVVTLLVVPLAAGYVAGRVAGHHRELNGALTGASFALYVVVMLLADSDFHFVDENFDFNFGFLPPLVLGPIGGWWGGQLAAGVNPLAWRLTSLDAAAAREQRRQQAAQARSGYKLVLLDDDKTPMSVVTEILKHFFGMEHGAAIATMLHIHDHGRAIADIFEGREAAETKLAELATFIAGTGHPLRCEIEASPG